MEEVHKYIYCIGDAARPVAHDLKGIGNHGEVYALFEEGLSAVISPSPADVDKYRVTRANTMAHQLVMEKAMQHGTILPVRFGTIAEPRNGVGPEEMIREKLLRERRKEFVQLLERMRGKVELGLKVLWAVDMSTIYGEILAENKEIRLMKARLQRRPKVPRDGRIGLGEMVKKALQAKREREARMLLRPLKKLAAEFRENDVSGDKMVANAAFLVTDDRVERFDRVVDDLGDRFGERFRLKYVGPVPPCNFVEIVVTWE